MNGQDSPRRVFPPVTVLILSLLTRGADGQVSADTLNPAPFPVYPPVGFQVVDVDHVLLRDSGQEPLGNSSLLAQSQAFLVTSPGRGGPLPAVNATYGPLSAYAPISPDLLLSGRRILPILLARQVRSSAPVLRVLFHLPTGRGSDIGRAAGADAGRKGASAKGVAHCVTAYAFWRTLEVRGACLLSPGGFCVAQLRPEPSWFVPAGRPAPREGGGGAEPQGNQAEVYFQSRRGRPGQCVPQDSLQRVGVGRGGPERSGTPLRRIGSVSLVKAPPGNPTFLRLRLGGAVVVQTSSKPLKTTDIATFYVFLSSVSTVENFTLRATVRKGLSFKEARPSDSALWDISVETGRAGPLNTITAVCLRKVAITGKRGLLEILQLDFETKESADQSESQVITWRLELPGNVKDVGIMRIYTTQRNYVGLAPIVMTNDLLNTAVLTGEVASVPVQTLAVGADGSITDVTNLTSCRSTQEDTLKVSERCDYVYVNGKETRGRTRTLLNFTYSYLSAQLEMSVWTPRLPLLIDVGDPELSQIKGWRVPVAAGSRGLSSDSEEDDEARKSRGCMLQYQHTLVRVLTPFTAEPSSLRTDRAGGEGSPEFFLGPDWLVDVTRLVRSSLRVADPSVARLQAGTTLQGRSPGTTTIQVQSPLSSSLLAERPIRVLEDRVSVTELGVQLVSGLSLTLQLSPGSNRAIVATATTQEVMTRPKQEAVVSCWVQFSDSSVTPLDLFDRASYSLAVTSEDETVATVRQTPRSAVVVAQGAGQGALVRAELRICEECQKTKRKSTMAVGVAVVRVDLETSEGGGAEGDGAEGGGGNAEPGPAVTSPRPLTDEGGDRRAFRSTLADRGEAPMTQTAVIVTVTATATATATKSVQQELARASTATISRVSSMTNTECPTVATTTTTTTTAKPVTVKPPVTGRPGVDKTPGRGNGQRRDWANMADGSKPPAKEKPRYKPPRVVESDLVRAFRNMSDLQIGILALVGVSCLAFLAFALNCASYKLCFGGDKTPIQGAADARGAPKDHKHDWVWLGTAQGPGQGNAPQGSTLKREGHRSESRGSVEGSLAVVSAVPERTATLGRRSSSLTSAPADSLATRSATLLAKPQRSEPLHSPTSKRNQVQFTTFTTLDIKHLAALKKNGVDFNWAGQGGAAVPPPQTPLPDMAWPVVRPVGEPQ